VTLTPIWVFGYVVFATVLLANVRYFRRPRRLGAELPDEPPSVSIVIPARNEEDNLRRLLPSLQRQSYPRFEIIVYDDRSDDGTWDVLAGCDDARLRTVRGGPLPPGWVGKTHALDEASRIATGDLLLFLDADAVLEDADALRRLVRRYRTLPDSSVLSGLTRLEGGGQLLVSLVPFVMLTHLPLSLATRHPSPHLSGMNGQCWMILRSQYEHLRPHRHHRGEVLEDIRIGRYLKSQGLTPHLLDLQDDVRVRMYGSLREAWVGFRKNVYPFLGETPLRFAAGFGSFVAFWVAAPLISPWFVVAWYVLKVGTDRLVHTPAWVSVLAPVTFVLSAALQLDSAIAHWTGRAAWKGRPIARRVVEAQEDRATP
jgi:glycosyltransferase involved in cell wall biosynthesis